VVRAVRDIFTGVESGPGVVVVRENRLDPGRPNPFREGTDLSFALVRPASVTLRVYDIAGRLVATLVEGTTAAGVHQARWDGRNAGGSSVASGIYFVRLRTPEYSEVQRVTRLR
jgi:hypothetical protein